MQLYKVFDSNFSLSGMLSEIEQSTTINHGPDMHAILFKFQLVCHIMYSHYVLWDVGHMHVS